MATHPQHPYMTVEDYFQLDNASPEGHYDYIDGQVILEVELYKQERDYLWSFRIFPSEANVELASLGIRIAVTDIYEGVYMPGSGDDQPA
jgi:Uma2 family endonuclease